MSEKKKKNCLFAGTFDPPTLGHKALVEECLKLFDEVVVAILVNPSKIPCFTLGQREEMLGLMFGKNGRVRVIASDRTVTELMKKEGVNFYARGIRNSITRMRIFTQAGNLIPSFPQYIFPARKSYCTSALPSCGTVYAFRLRLTST